ncbi:hypothetical protein DPEC_G00326420 [Dallia pectoralis]|uniref:Uncharacterized protein n=1 Tax=Dallia pectoralis TaxID=75939 RepID=A0ACC2F7Y0_DALPE|nr:hypothetical protein DPEC_G00326420 [Dallia pectoralis]
MGKTAGHTRGITSGALHPAGPGRVGGGLKAHRRLRLELQATPSPSPSSTPGSAEPQPGSGDTMTRTPSHFATPFPLPVSGSQTSTDRPGHYPHSPLRRKAGLSSPVDPTGPL